MLKARNRKISMLLVLAMLMTMFVGVGAASAAGVTYSVEKATDVTIGDGKDLGIIMVKVPEVSIIDDVYGDFISVSLPSGLEFADKANADSYVSLPSKLKNGGSYTNNITADGRTLNLRIARNGAVTEGATLQIKLNNINVKDASGEISVLVGGPAGSIFPQAGLTLGKAVSKGSTTASAKSVKSMGDNGVALDTFIIMENMAGTLQNSAKVKVKLPNGFTWNDKNGPTVVGDWGLAGKVTASPYTGEGTRELEFTLTLSPSAGTAGRITLNNLFVDVDDTNRLGDVTVSISGTNISSQDVVVAKYGTFGFALTESTVKDLTAGKSGRELGAFVIEEDIAGSLVNGRTITMELPAGVKWESAPEVVVNKGNNLVSGGWTLVNGSKGRTLKATVNASTTVAAKNLFEKGKVYIEPGFEGAIEIVIGGTAGVEGKIKVAEVKPAVKMTAENVKNIVLGTQSQQVGDILITESTKEAILRGTNQDTIVVGIDAGYTFAKKPKVQVVEGDLEINSSKMNSAGNELTITIKYNSSKPSAIKISDVYLTGLRYAPEGTVKAYLVEAEGTVGGTVSGSTALDAGWVGTLGNGKLSEVSAGEVVIANCVTAAPGETVGNGQFRINSNIYYVGGAAKVMDVAPYIKDNRTYVPMRYVAEILGAEVVWDDAARTVTLTKGEDVAVFTIGSTTYTVNGEAKTADVAPEIANSRTMLPARFVAEAFGAVVGWDAGTQTVLIQK